MRSKFRTSARRHRLRPALAAVALAVLGWWLWSCSEPNVDAPTGASPDSDVESAYPHPDNYRQPELHGVDARELGLDHCRECHGDNLKGGWSGVSCMPCHADGFTGSPHPDNYSRPDLHGADAREQGLDYCRECHGDKLNGGSSGVSCLTCHDDGFDDEDDEDD